MKGRVYAKDPNTPSLLPNSTRSTQETAHAPSPSQAHPQASEQHYQEPKFRDGRRDGDVDADLANSIGVLFKVVDLRVRAGHQCGGDFDRNGRGFGV